MSLKQLKAAENSPAYSAYNLQRTQQRRWKSTWSFNPEIIPSPWRLGSASRSSIPERERITMKKAIVRKYYGKKILVVDVLQDRIVSRSKLLKCISIEENVIKLLRSKGRLVILAAEIEDGQRISWENTDMKQADHVLSKKIVKHCEKSEIFVKCKRDLKLVKYFLASKSLEIGIHPNDELKVESLGRFFRNCLSLEELNVKVYGNDDQDSNSKNHPEGRFFAELHELIRLKRASFDFDFDLLQKLNLEQDLDKFNQQAVTFRFSILIRTESLFRLGQFRVESPLVLGKHSNVAKLLKGTEYLSVCEPGDMNQERISLAEEDQKKMKLNKKYIVEIFGSSKGGIDVARVLSCCDSLENLHIRENHKRIKWNNDQEEEIKGLRNIKVAALEFQHLFAHDPYESFRAIETENKEGFSQFASPFFVIFSQIKQRSLSLQSFHLYFAETFQWTRPYCVETPIFQKNYSQFLEAASTSGKLKKVGLILPSDGLSRCLPLNQLISNNSIESVELIFYVISGKLAPKWDSDLEIHKSTQLKELKIIIPSKVKISLLEISLLKVIRSLENLQVVELLDMNLEAITFDFLHGFVTSLLEKKFLRKLCIVTKVINSFSLENLELTMPNKFGSQFKNMLNEVFQELENRINELKDLQLEEILIGKLKGYNFDYMLFSKEMGIVDKYFWKEEEMSKMPWKSENWKKGGLHNLFSLCGENDDKRNTSFY